jgi:hypothetical protein
MGETRLLGFLWASPDFINKKRKEKIMIERYH